MKDLYDGKAPKQAILNRYERYFLPCAVNVFLVDFDINCLSQKEKVKCLVDFRTKQALDFIPGGQVLKVAIDFGDEFYSQGLDTRDIFIKKYDSYQFRLLHKINRIAFQHSELRILWNVCHVAKHYKLASIYHPIII